MRQLQLGMIISWAHFILLVSDRTGIEPRPELQNLNRSPSHHNDFPPGTESLIKEKLVSSIFNLMSVLYVESMLLFPSTARIIDSHVLGIGTPTESMSFLAAVLVSLCD